MYESTSTSNGLQRQKDILILQQKSGTYHRKNRRRKQKINDQKLKAITTPITQIYTSDALKQESVRFVKVHGEA